MATLQGKAVKNTYRQVLQIGANNVGVSGTMQPVQDGAGVNTALSLSTAAATINGTLTITGDLIITGGGIQIQDLIDDTVASLIQNGTGITWAYNDGARTLTPTITIATADGGVQGDFLQLNVNANEASAVGKLKWNTADGTMDIGLMGGNVVLQVGQEQVARVLNNSGTNFTEAGYQAVKITSAQGQRLAVGLAQANNEANSKDTLGLVTENISNNQEGFVTTSGLVRQIDTTGDLQTEVWVDGDTLYLSPTVPGRITKVKPLAPNQTVIMGFVVYAHKNQGKIFVKVDNGYEISELHDVRITSVANNNILKYNSSLAVWENVAGTTTNISEGTNLYYTQGRFDSAFAAKTTTNLAEGANLYFTEARGNANFATNFATKTTTNLPEGTNLYYTDTRSRAALAVTAGTGIAYNSTTGVFNLGSIPNASLTNSSVTVNGLSLALGASITLTTTNIAEGTNLYWTDARFDTRFSTKTTTNLAEGSNLYYTQTRFNTAFTAKSTTDLAEGTNLYYTDARSRAAISESAVGLDYSSGSGVLSLTAGYAIPTTVKLGQYDTAYNRSIVSAAVTGTTTKTLSLTQQDANVVSATWTDLGITTINGTANQILATTAGNTTTIAFTNDVTMPNNLVVSGNLTINGTATYVNTQSISAKDPLFEVANDNNTTDAVDIGYYGRYYDTPQLRVEFTGLFRDASDAGKFKFFTGLVDEPTNVVNTTGTGYTVGTLVANFEGNLAGTANAANALSTARTIAASGDAVWSVSFDGSANVSSALTLANTGVTASTYGTSTAVPTIAIDSKGRITSASNTNITFPVTTVNGFAGTVVLTTTNVAEGTNQYFTSARAQSAITGGASSVVTADLTASRALVSDGTGKIAASASTTATEIGYVAGVTSAIQTQLNTKLSTATAASTYLPLAGGTLTGALSGTSATFSGNLTIDTDTLFVDSTNNRVGIGTSSPNTWASNLVVYNNQLTITGAGYDGTFADSIFFGGNNEGTTYRNKISNSLSATASAQKMKFSVASGATTWVDALTLTGTGAATFSGLLAVNGQYVQIANASNPSLYLSNTTVQWQVYNKTSNNNFAISDAVRDVLTLGYNGSASFFQGCNVGIGNTGNSSYRLLVSGNNASVDSNGQNTIFLSAGTSVSYIDTSYIGGGSYVPMAFGTGGSEKMRIQADGTILAGTQNDAFFNGSITGVGLYGPNGFIAASRGNSTCAFFNRFSSTGDIVQFRYNGGNVGTISYNGTIVQYNATSDYRLKEDLKEYNALNIIGNLKTYDFKWKNTDVRDYGMMAHELQEVLPNYVNGEKDAIDEDGEIKAQGVDYSKIVPILVKAIQELTAKIDALEAK